MKPMRAKKEIIKRLEEVGGEITFRFGSFNKDHQENCRKIHSWGSYWRLDFEDKDRQDKLAIQYIFGNKKESKDAFNKLKEMMEVRLTEEDEENCESLESEKNIVKKKEESGFVYFIRSGKFYKIGRAKQMKSRTLTYRTENPNRIFLLGQKYFEDYVGVEKQLLEKYKEFNHRGEWFKLSPIQVKEIKDFLS